MAQEGRRDHRPWAPYIEGTPLFITGAQYERALGKIGLREDLESQDSFSAAADEEPEPPAIGAPP